MSALILFYNSYKQKSLGYFVILNYSIHINLEERDLEPLPTARDGAHIAPLFCIPEEEEP
jgi:hypothetical protein